MFAEFSNAVLQASRRPEVRDAVLDLYTHVQREIDQRRPVCVVSGRCCKFEEFGHRLYVSTLELAAFVHDFAALPNRPQLLQALAEFMGMGCPFQINKLCAAHLIRPFGCRIFFCDASAGQWQSDQYERFHARLKRLHEELEAPYYYVEWRQALAALGEVLQGPGRPEMA